MIHIFTTYAKVDGQVVHSPSMKLRILLNKLKADFLVHVKAGINSELTIVNMIMYYKRALAAFRNEVNRKNPPQMFNVPDRLWDFGISYVCETSNIIANTGR